MAAAAASPGAAPLPVKQGVIGALLFGALLGGVTLEAQRSRLSYGLRAGRREVAVGSLPARGGTFGVWMPVADSGRFPLLLLGSADRASQDTARAAYFASHGFVVVLIPAARARVSGFEDAWRGARELSFVDSARVAVLGAGAAMRAAREFAATEAAVVALADLDADAAQPASALDRPIPVLSWRASTGALEPARRGRLLVRLPPGSSDPFRLVTAVTHAFINAALGRGPASLSQLGNRLRRTRLEVRGWQELH